LIELVKRVAVFNRLMARGVDFTAMRDDDGATLCHYVAYDVTSENVLRFLVNVSCNDAIHAVDNYGDGETPLHRASFSGNHLAMRVQLGTNSGQTALPRLRHKKTKT
jgi:hypothetical protein